MKTPSLNQRMYSERELEELQVKAQPFPWYTLTNRDKVDADREIWCPIYKQCLDRAADASWQGFTCRFCPNFKPKEATQ